MSKLSPTTQLFKALMHPARLAILDNLRDGEQCVCHLESVLGYRQAYISQHLMVLREAGLVEDQREGARIFYRVTRPEVFELVDTACLLSGTEMPQNSPLRGKACSCPKCASVEQVPVNV